MEESQVNAHRDPLEARGFKILRVVKRAKCGSPVHFTLILRTADQFASTHGRNAGADVSSERSDPTDRSSTSSRAARLVRAYMATHSADSGALHAKIAADGSFVLYLHGWSDYFFHEHVADAANSAGFDFCAVDLRAYGRSVRNDDTPTAIDALEEYTLEIDAAIDVMSQGRGVRRAPLIYGHSTGGLTAALWAADHPGRSSGLILNSPWLELHGGKAVRRAVTPIVAAGAARRGDRRILPHGHDFYARAHRQDFGGEWDWEESWKPARGLPFPASTLAAVVRAQRRVAAGLELDIPVLAAFSKKSAFRPRYSYSLARVDTVIDVRSARRAAKQLGPNVCVVSIPGAAHDIALSTVGPRTHFLHECLHWVNQEWAKAPRV